MTLLFFLSFCLGLTATLVLAASPIVLGLWVLMFALFSAIALSVSHASWVGLMIFIIYVGGLLVMFAYFVALTPNLIIEGVTMVSLASTSALFFFTLFVFSTPINLKTFTTYSNHPIIIFFTLSPVMVIIIAVVLFIALISVVKLCRRFSAPLRPFSSYVIPSPQNTPFD